MEPNLGLGMGWIPDIPSISDYTPETPSIAEIITRNNEVVRSAAAAPSRGTRRGGGGAATAVAYAPGAAAQVDLRPWFSTVENQGGIGSCTANAAVGLVEYFERRAFGKYLDASRMFVYKTTRNMLGWKGDTGAYIRSAMGALALFGAPPERYWPYVEAQFDAEPTPFCYAFGQNYKAIQYYRLDNTGVTPAALLQAIKDKLTAGFPAMFGFPCYEEFMHVPADAKVAFPAKNSKLYGGHAIVAAGYDDNMMIGQDKGALLIRNSWGTGWGDKGYAWMSYRYVTEGLALDWWSLLKCDWVETGQFGLVMP